MHNLEKVVSKWEKGALVLIFSNANDAMPLVRPAAFIYAIRGGLAWVEPYYADPYGASSPGLHIRSGEIQEKNDGFELRGSSSEIKVYPFDERDPATKNDAEPLRWFANYLRENSLQWQAERERVRKLIARSIKEHAADMKAHKAAEEA